MDENMLQCADCFLFFDERVGHNNCRAEKINKLLDALERSRDDYLNTNKDKEAGAMQGAIDLVKLHLGEG